MISAVSISQTVGKSFWNVGFFSFRCGVKDRIKVWRFVGIFIDVSLLRPHCELEREVSCIWLISKTIQVGAVEKNLRKNDDRITRQMSDCQLGSQTSNNYSIFGYIFIQLSSFVMAIFYLGVGVSISWEANIDTGSSAFISTNLWHKSRSQDHGWVYVFTDQRRLWLHLVSVWNHLEGESNAEIKT